MANSRVSHQQQSGKSHSRAANRTTLPPWVWVLVIGAAIAVPATTWIKSRATMDSVYQPQTQKLGTTKLKMPDGSQVEVEVARTAREREIGLMNRTKIPLNTGMLFVYESESQHTFWMKNTLVSLDMVFIGADKRVTSVADRVPKTSRDTLDRDIPRRSGYGQFVLELAAGAAAHYGIKTGSPLLFDFGR